MYTLLWIKDEVKEAHFVKVKEILADQQIYIVEHEGKEVLLFKNQIVNIDEFEAKLFTKKDNPTNNYEIYEKYIL